jgi:hypothetical protein
MIVASPRASELALSPAHTITHFLSTQSGQGQFDGARKSHAAVSSSSLFLCKFCANILRTRIFIDKIGCPTWIRTMNNASKGRCVTITPSDKPDKTRLFMVPAQSENHPAVNLSAKESLPGCLFGGIMPR